MLVSANELIGFSHPAVALRKSAVLEVGGYRQAFWPAEDIDLWNRLVEKGYKVLVQPEYLLDYRLHGNSASISQARLTRSKVRWLKDCMLHRRSGMEEPDWESFLAAWRAAPLLFRLNKGRRDLAKILYKAAVMHYAQGGYPAMILNLMGAVFLQPCYTIRQVRTKLVIPSR
jgi:GT2 family glycosyltransferase